ncbi:MAG TPA: efflux RND transporter periplasmic adaptor subunit [Candidatus Saccharimonadales bacterium]|jgi:multidrug efflux system membrane fusion protein|nr:efflux RND transporter periplasmic adaptor subunit [Candidatus Saccharimonadales bacterium]
MMMNTTTTKDTFTQLCLLMLALLAAGCSGRDAVQAAKQAPAAPVTVTMVASRTVPLQLQAIGNVEAISTVSIKPQISGQLMGVHFQDGDFVKKGQLLFTIDRAPFEADLRHAEGMLARDLAQTENARLDAERYKDLGREGVVSRQQVEATAAAYNALAAAAAADKAAVETAKINLAYTTIYSPIHGRTGNVAVKAGNLVKANDVPVLVAINQIEPIYVSFAIPEQQLAELKKYSAGKVLTVHASLQGSGQQFDGKLSFIDNAVDLTTGTIKLKATFDNRQHALWPGQFVDCSLTLTSQTNAIVVPNAALQTGQSGTYVYVVDQDLTARIQPVKVARTLGDDTVIASGLQPGQRVVTDGQLQVLPGNKVSIKNGS